MTRETDTDLSDASLGHQYSRRKRQDLSRRVALAIYRGIGRFVAVTAPSLFF
ncbi:MAG: hypothetical protein KGZ50_08570 [Peptococcaceae bacterium]|nr:hypothetical protein [Peptococcaceae bacterium]